MGTVQRPATQCEKRGGDLLALRFAVAAPSPTEVERHPTTIHRLSALDVVLSAEPGQGAQADGSDAFQLG